MEAFKMFIGSQSPMVEEILKKLSVEEKRFIEVIPDEEALFKKIKRVQHSVVIVDQKSNWTETNKIPNRIKLINERSSSVLLTEKTGLSAFSNSIALEQLLEYCQKTIREKKNIKLIKVV